MRIKTALWLFSFQETDGKVIFFDGHGDRCAQAWFLQSPVPHHSPSQAIFCHPLAEPQAPGQLSPPKNVLSTLFFGFFFFFFHLQTCCYSNPSILSALRGIFISSSAAPWKHTPPQPLSPSLLGGGEADPTTPCPLEQGVPHQLGRYRVVGGAVEGPSHLGGAAKKPLAMTSAVLPASAGQKR